MKSVSYSSSSYLSCAKCGGTVILCIDPDKTVSGQPFIEAQVASSNTQVGCHGETIYLYSFTYEDGLLVEVQGEPYTLIPEDINGVLCKGCLTDYIESIVPTPGGFCFVYNENDLIAAEANSNCQTIFIVGVVTLTAERTLTKTYVVLDGFYIVTAGFVLNIVGNFATGPYQCFITTTGEVNFGSGAHGFGTTTKIYLEWFGATGDGATDDTTAIQAALDAQYPSFIPIEIPPRRVYRISTITLSERCTMYGVESNAAAPIFRSNAAAPMFVFKDVGANFQSYNELRNIYIDGNLTATVGVVNNYNNFNRIIDCNITRCDIGIDHSRGGYWTKIFRNVFYDNIVAISVSEDSNEMLIEKNTFDGTGGRATSAINIDAGNWSDHIKIIENSFEQMNGVALTDIIYGEARVGYADSTIKVVRNRIEGNPSNSFVNLGIRTHAIVKENLINGNTDNGILLNGADGVVNHNYFVGFWGTGAIVLGTTATHCHVGTQQYSTSAPTYPVIDSGVRNTVDLGAEKVVGGTWTLAANTIVTDALRVPPGGQIITNGFTLTIKGSFSAGLYKCFTTSLGDVIFYKGSTEKVYLEWFGATGDGVTDDTAAITLALNAASTAFIPVIPLSNRTYIVDALSLPAKTTLGTDSIGEASPIFKRTAVGVGTLISLPSPGGESYVHLHGIIFQGTGFNTTTLIDINGNSHTSIHDCYFWQASVGVTNFGSGVNNQIFRNKFLDVTTGVSITGAFFNLDIYNNYFVGSYTNAIISDNATNGFGLNIVENIFRGSNITNVISLLVSNGYQGFLASIARNNFVANTSTSFINVGQFAQVSIKDNQFSGNSANHIIIAGTFCEVDGNYFTLSSNAAISLTNVATDTVIGLNKWGSGGAACASQLLDNSITRTTLRRRILKDTTPNRPTMVTNDVGALYLDTTLDADGLPIWWNGAKWIKADGSDA